MKDANTLLIGFPFIFSSNYVTTTYFPRQKVENSLILQFKARISVPVGYVNHEAFFVG